MLASPDENAPMFTHNVGKSWKLNWLKCIYINCGGEKTSLDHRKNIQNKLLSKCQSDRRGAYNSLCFSSTIAQSYTIKRRLRSRLRLVKPPPMPMSRLWHCLPNVRVINSCSVFSPTWHKICRPKYFQFVWWLNHLASSEGFKSASPPSCSDWFEMVIFFFRILIFCVISRDGNSANIK